VFQRQYWSGGAVTDDHGLLLGLVAERDFIASDSKIYLPTYIKLLTDIDFVKSDKKHLSPEAQAIINATASDIMNSQVVTVSPETDINELAEIFGTKRVNPIPVVDESNKLVGIISRSDLIKLFSTRHIDA
jgi:CBS domain-containing protein